MQTFLPYNDMGESVKCLDYRRLGKQRVEAKQILNALTNSKYGWQNHPAVKMWRGYEEALKLYMNICILEWISRGYKNSMDIVDVDSDKFELPFWYGDEKFHRSHRSNLLRKDFAFYSKYWNDPIDLEYVWPVK